MGKLIKSYYNQVYFNNGPNVMYDIEVKDNHNYFANGVLVHNCKSPQSQQGKNFLKLSSVGSYHYGLTGTLLVNSPLDSYTAMKFIGEEKATYGKFKSFYCVYEQQFGHQQIVGYKNLDILKEQISECSLRRDKSILNLPPKYVVPEYVELTPEHENFYVDLSNGVVEEADRVNITTKSLLGLIVRLRQASTCPSLLTSADIVNNKLERAAELVEDIVSNGEKVVIFSTFKEPIYQLYDMLKQYNPLLGIGDLTQKDVDNNIDLFQNDPNYKIILGTFSKISTGITLTAASYMIMLDTPWTYAEFGQACDRIYRIGTNNSVIIYNLIARGTIDERVNSLLEQKKGISDYLVDDKMPQKEELKYLLGV